MSKDTKTEHRCQNPSCRKLLTGRRSDTKFCDSSCRYTGTRTTTTDSGEEREVYVSTACRYPRQQQAEITERWRGRRHPFSGNRPEQSGYCVISTCECTCHPENAPVDA